MKRSITLISVSITAFSVVLLASVFYAVRAAASGRTAHLTAISDAPELRFSPELEAAAEVASPRISPEAAATAASEFLNRTDALSVQLADYNGQQAYMVTFASGDVVYISMQGQVLGSVPAGVQMASSNTRERDWDSHGEDRHEDGEGEHDSEHDSEVGD